MSPFAGFLDSFKPAEQAKQLDRTDSDLSETVKVEGPGSATEADEAGQPAERKRVLKGWHIQMIAIGGSIGKCPAPLPPPPPPHPPSLLFACQRTTLTRPLASPTRNRTVRRLWRRARQGRARIPPPRIRGRRRDAVLRHERAR